jgi:chemotaxis protein MotB
MKIKLFFPVLIIVAVMAQSCVSSKKYNQLQTDYNRLDSNTRDMRRRFLTSERNLAVVSNRAKSLEEQIASERSNVKALQAALDKCLSSSSQGNVNISKLVDEINSSNKYIQQLVNAKNKSDSLNMVLTNNLTRSLSQQEMQDVNVQVLKGVVYISLADNMLYKSGSYEISDKAGATLSKIAKIIKDYNNYDVLIEGNTDNVPITQKNIRNNWDLSALRASSVVMALQNNYQVDPKRLTAGGRGEFNPIADNTTEAGKAKNRRTQIIITPKLDQFMDLIGKAPEKP